MKMKIPAGAAYAMVVPGGFLRHMAARDPGRFGTEIP